MRENKLRTLWANDQAAVNGWLAIANSFCAETMAHQGWDTLTIDLQHGVVDYQAMVGMLQAISTTATVASTATATVDVTPSVGGGSGTATATATVTAAATAPRTAGGGGGGQGVGRHGRRAE